MWEFSLATRFLLGSDFDFNFSAGRFSFNTFCINEIFARAGQIIYANFQNARQPCKAGRTALAVSFVAAAHWAYA